MFVPLALVAVSDTIADPTWRRGLWLGAVAGLQCLASMYIGLMLVTVLVLFAAVALLRARTTSLPRLAAAVGAAACLLLPVAALLYVPYHNARAEHGERPIDRRSPDRQRHGW